MLPTRIAGVLWRGVVDPKNDLRRKIAIICSFTASGTRLASGMRVGQLGPRPEKALLLYDFEACPFCRRVREAISMLDLEVDIRPCPKGGMRFRPEAKRIGGDARFPFLIDPNTGEAMYESANIVRYLYERYGRGELPATIMSPTLHVLSAAAMPALTAASGMRARMSTPPAEPLALWGYEASAYTRFVRQTLCELELPYRLRPTAVRSPGRKAFLAEKGKLQFPYLEDPNTGAKLFESREIERYLHATYGV
jgi:glutathione S-transferase